MEPIISSSNEQIILDLDVSSSIRDLESSFSTNYVGDAIHKIIILVKTFGTYLGIIAREAGSNELTQYQLKIKYLGNILPVVFEFDYTMQFINMVYYNSDQSKIYLKIFLSIADDPTIKYVENDKTGVVPGYSDDNITMKPGEYLINFTHRLVSYIGFNKMRLDDDSYLIRLGPNGLEQRTKLWLYLLLSREKSWYAKFGYQAINSTDCDMALSDMKNLRMDDVCSTIKCVINASNKRDLNPILLETCNILLTIIGDSCETLGEFTTNHTIDDFTNLTNNLTQSIFGRKVFVRQGPVELDDDDSGESSDDSTYTTIEFSWYEKYRRLQIANVMQINCNIADYYYAPKN